MTPLSKKNRFNSKSTKVSANSSFRGETVVDANSNVFQRSETNPTKDETDPLPESSFDPETKVTTPSDDTTITQKHSESEKKEGQCFAPGVPAKATNGRSDHTERNLEKLLDAFMERSQQLESILDKVNEQRTELYNEAQAVNQNYQRLYDKILHERDSLSAQLRHERTEVLRERNEYDRRIGTLTKELESAQEQLSELNEQLREALASRDKIASRVEQVETKLEQTLLPIREELETARMREKDLQRDLKIAQKETQTLKLLSLPPEGSS